MLYVRGDGDKINIFCGVDFLLVISFFVFS